jgi:hypothetical protein
MTVLADLPPAITVERAAGLLDTSPKSLARLILSGRYPGRAFKVGRTWRLVTADLIAFIEGDRP